MSASAQNTHAQTMCYPSWLAWLVGSDRERKGELVEVMIEVAWSSCFYFKGRHSTGTSQIMRARIFPKKSCVTFDVLHTNINVLSLQIYV